MLFLSVIIITQKSVNILDDHYHTSLTRTVALRLTNCFSAISWTTESWMNSCSWLQRAVPDRYSIPHLQDFTASLQEPQSFLIFIWCVRTTRFWWSQRIYVPKTTPFGLFEFRWMLFWPPKRSSGLSTRFFTAYISVSATLTTSLSPVPHPLQQLSRSKESRCYTPRSTHPRCSYVCYDWCLGRRRRGRSIATVSGALSSSFRKPWSQPRPGIVRSIGNFWPFISPSNISVTF